MPTAAGPNTKGQENLVFGYDLGDTRNLFKGEPTVNLAPAGGRTGASALPRQSYHVLAWTYSLETNVNGRPDVIRMYINPPGDTGQPYTDFGFQSSKPGGSVVGDVYTISFDYYVAKGNSVPSFGSVYADGYKSPTSANVATTLSDTTKDLGNGWYRRTRTVELTAAGNTFWRGGINSNNLETEAYIDNIQLEYKGHETPFVDGTRSATQGLIDLTGNSTIDLTNVSFDSDAQITFDGTGDYVNLSNGLANVDTTVLSVEMVFKSTSTDTSFRPLLGINSDQTNVGYICLGDFTGHWSNESLSCIFVNSSGTIFLSFAYTAGGSALKDNQYHHIVFNFQTNNYKIFVDGEEVAVNASFRNGSQSTSMISNLFNTIASPNVTVGYAGSTSNAFLGDIPITKVYSRALTASEIKANYNAIKGRFNI